MIGAVSFGFVIDVSSSGVRSVDLRRARHRRDVEFVAQSLLEYVPSLCVSETAE